jgi:diguanylate cyclase (GGDEF)-like protein
MNIITPCGYELTISLLDQKSERALDSCFNQLLKTINQGTQACAFFFSKHFSQIHTPVVVFNSLEEPLSDDKIELYLAELKKLSPRIEMHYYQKRHVFPAKFDNTVLGFLVIEADKHSIEPYTAVIAHLLNVYVKQLSTLHYACIDPLSQLLNRQTFEEKVLSVVARDHHAALRQGYAERRWYLAMLDIDNFKSVNDTFGHVIGDEVILLVAQLLKDNFRAEDYVFRYGGEEFAALFPSQDAETAFKGLDKIRALIAKKRFPQVGSVTVSGGYVSLVNIGQALEAVNQADQALYHSKQAGRNTITYFDDLDIKPLMPKQKNIELF